MTFDDLKNRFEEDAGKFNGLNATVKFDFKEDGFIVLDATTTPRPFQLKKLKRTAQLKFLSRTLKKWQPANSIPSWLSRSAS